MSDLIERQAAIDALGDEPKVMFKVVDGKDPYTEIGEYIRNHITAIEDIIATIEIDGIKTNELFMVDVQEDGYFVWESDWYEGEKNIALIDFFPVSEAQRANQNVQSADTISRQDAIDEIKKCRFVVDAIEKIRGLPSTHPEVKPIDYRDCADAMLMMWMWNVLTDGEYYRIMDKLNRHETERRNDG